MPRFQYTAKDNTGKIYKGSMDAVGEDQVTAKLNEVGLLIVSLSKERKSIFSRKRRISNTDLVTLTQQLADLVSAGIPLLKSLQALERQVDNPALKDIVQDIGFSIEGGSAFSQALAKHPEIFSEFFIGMIKAGETGGYLGKVLDRLAIHLERQHDLRQKVQSAFAYPVLVGILACLVVTFLIIVIVPIFSKVYTQMKIVLPGPTRTLIFISFLVRRYWWAVLSLIGGVVFVYSRIKHLAKFRQWIDEAKLKMPVFGKLNRLAAVSRFIRTLGDMLSSGIPALEALDVANKVIGNTSAEKIVGQMRESVKNGGLISAPLMNQNIFPATTAQMMMAGEESGTLDSMLEKNANSLDRDIDILIKRIVVTVEPLLTAILAAVVGFIAMAVYFPIFDLIQQISGA
ncbi:MAG: type II secretion system F family protein [Candidatus Omnitrophota bacterium]